MRNGDDIVYLAISVPVCQTCGERYYDIRTMKRLEEAEQQLKENKLTLKEIGRVLEAV